MTLLVLLKATRCPDTWRLGRVWPLGSTRFGLSCASLRVYCIGSRLEHLTGWQPVGQKKDESLWGGLWINTVALKPAWLGWIRTHHLVHSHLLAPLILVAGWRWVDVKYLLSSASLVAGNEVENSNLQSIVGIHLQRATSVSFYSSLKIAVFYSEHHKHQKCRHK